MENVTGLYSFYFISEIVSVLYGKTELTLIGICLRGGGDVKSKAPRLEFLEPHKKPGMSSHVSNSSSVGGFLATVSPPGSVASLASME